MTTPLPRHPWWKRKRTWGAVAAWLTLAYPLSAAPVSYAVERGWVSEDAVAIAYLPAVWVMERTPLVDPWRRLNDWFRIRGIIHAERRLLRQSERPVFLD